MICINVCAYVYYTLSSLIYKYLYHVLVPVAVITQHPESHLIDLYTHNFSTTLKCRARGYKLMYSWTRNNIPILPSSHFVVKGSDLVIINVTPSDSDHYQCIVSSLNLTVHSKYATVTVKGKWVHTSH